MITMCTLQQQLLAVLRLVLHDHYKDVYHTIVGQSTKHTNKILIDPRWYAASKPIHEVYLRHQTFKVTELGCLGLGYNTEKFDSPYIVLPGKKLGGGPDVTTGGPCVGGGPDIFGGGPLTCVGKGFGGLTPGCGLGGGCC